MGPSGEVGNGPGRRWAGPVAVVVLVPLAVLPAANGPFHAVKWWATLTLVPVGLVLTVVERPLQWPLRRWWLVWLGVLGTATLASVAPWVSLAGSPQRNAGLLAWLVSAGAFVLGASTGDHPATRRRTLRAAFVVGAAVGLIAVLERADVDLLGLGDLDETTRARSTWGNATFAAAHLTLVGPLAIAHLRAENARWRRLASVSTIAIGAGVLATGSRGALLGLAAAAVVMVPAWRGAGDRAPGRKLPTSAVAAIGVALVVALALMVPDLGRASGAGRLDQWRTAVSPITERPVLGSGPDTQRIVLPSAIDEHFEREHGSEVLHDRAHNLVLDTAITTGVVGLVALAALLVAIGRRIAATLGRQLVGRAIAGGLVAYLVHLGFAFGDPVLDPIAWLLVGLLVAAVGPGGQAGNSEGAPRVHRPRRVPAATTLAGVTVAAFLWGGGEVVAVHRLDAALDARRSSDPEEALDLLDSASATAPARFDLPQIRARVVEEILSSRPEDAPGLTEDALSDLDDALALAPGDPELLLDRGTLLNTAGRHQEALAQFEAVLEGPYPESSRGHLGLGLAAAELGDEERAVDAWERAAELAPGDPRALVNLGLLHAAAGRVDEATTAFEAALEREPEHPVATEQLARLAP